MQSMFNGEITVQTRITGVDDVDGNKTYTYPNVLINERCRASIKILNKLTDDKNWITYKVRRFLIKNVSTDLSDATHIIYNSKYYKIDKIIEPESFNRVKSRIIETEYKEGKA